MRIVAATHNRQVQERTGLEVDNDRGDKRLAVPDRHQQGAFVGDKVALVIGDQIVAALELQLVVADPKGPACPENLRDYVRRLDDHTVPREKPGGSSDVSSVALGVAHEPLVSHASVFSLLGVAG